jgi:hypothetical protein
MEEIRKHRDNVKAAGNRIDKILNDRSEKEAWDDPRYEHRLLIAHEELMIALAGLVDALDSRDKYNGWLNYETWNTWTWLSGSDVWLLWARTGIAESETAAQEIASVRSVYVNSAFPVSVFRDGGATSDLVSHSLARVDWGSIVRALKE